MDEVLSWLDLEESARPRFNTLEVDVAIEKVDAHLGRLISGIQARGLADQVNLVVVSDHGMAAAHPEKLIFLDDYIDLEAIQLIGMTPVAM